MLSNMEPERLEDVHDSGNAVIVLLEGYFYMVPVIFVREQRSKSNGRNIFDDIGVRCFLEPGDFKIR